MFPWIQIHGPIEADGRQKNKLRLASGFRGFKSTAPLKLQKSHLVIRRGSGFPWIQIHGPIEADRLSIRAEYTKEFPWIQIHGPIEATVAAEVFVSAAIVSVDSNPRPH